MTTKLFISLPALILLLTCGCSSYIPTSNFPAQMERRLEASFEDTWEAVFKVVEALDGVVIAEDKPTGLIVYKFKDTESDKIIYMHVYLKDLADQGATRIYAVPQADPFYRKTPLSIVFSTFDIAGGYHVREIEKDFFEKVTDTFEARDEE